jgi:transcriptional regulator with XRE-family HTH domain
MTPKQCEAARRLLGWSRARLAAYAGVRDIVVLEFERGQRTLRPEQFGAMRAALEAEGIEFSPDAYEGLGVNWRTSRSEAPDRARYLRYQATETRAAARKPGLRREALRLEEVAREMEAQADAIEAEFGAIRIVQPLSANA